MTEEKLQRAHEIKREISDLKFEMDRYDGIDLLSINPAKLVVVMDNGMNVLLDVERAAVFIRGELEQMQKTYNERILELKREFEEL